MDLVPREPPKMASPPQDSRKGSEHHGKRDEHRRESRGSPSRRDKGHSSEDENESSRRLNKDGQPDTYGTSRHRPKAPPGPGYMCKWCGTKGGNDDSHWHQTCPLKEGAKTTAPQALTEAHEPP